MASAAFDALKFVDDLEAVKVPREQARVIVDMVRRSHDIADGATKADLANLEHKLDAKIDGVEQRLNGKIDLLRKDMLGIEQNLNGKIDLVRKDMESMYSGLRKDMDSMQQGMQKDMGALENRLIIKLGLMMAAMLGITGTLVGILLRVMLQSA